jgi:hypothetical protein
MSSSRTQTRMSARSAGHRAAAGASGAAESVATSPWLARLARVGLAARATIYVVLGLLSLQLVQGKTHKEIDQNGAFRTIAKESYGPLLLWVLVVGFLSYAVWRATEVVYGEVGGGSGAKERVASAFRAVAYAALALTALSVVLGRNTKSGSAGQNRTMSASLMHSTAGRVLVGIVGFVVAIVGATMVYEGWKEKFLRYLRTDQMNATTRKTVTNLGRYGTIARGVVFVIVGLLTLRAAWQHKPKDAGGIDEAIKTMAKTPGSFLLILVAIGLIAFGIYGFAEARWRKTERGSTAESPARAY